MITQKDDILDYLIEINKNYINSDLFLYVKFYFEIKKFYPIYIS